MSVVCENLPAAVMEPLRPLNFPLFGARLIEASAGTGKTFTIAALYLRLLLGHGGEQAYPKPLTVPEILVVTFTEAATEELRGRIRKRIHEARCAFIQDESDDFLLQELLKEVSDHAEAAQRLLLAERQMDEAAIFTIHGFCQRMLAQNAFESGALFESELITDELPLALRAVMDFWRKHFYAADGAIIEAITEHWESPEALWRDLARWFKQSEIQLEPALPFDTVEAGFAHYQRELLDYQTQIDTLRAQWRAARSEIETQTRDRVSRYTGKTYDNWLAKIDLWASNRDSQFEETLERFAIGLLSEKMKKGEAPPKHPIFQQIETFLVHAPNKPTLRPAILTLAAAEVRQRLAQSKGQEGVRAFDDLLIDLDAALGSSHGARLRELIVSQYPVAMIDEFQDTDPLQYRIFSRLYPPSDSSRERALLLIGDPKQAIYAFRGADIYTYMQARREIRAHYSLDTNYRSSEPLVRAVNHLFSQNQNPFIEAEIPFVEVKAKGTSKELQRNGVALPALQFWRAPEAMSGEAYQQQMAEATALEIKRLLLGAQSGTVSIGDEPLRPADIAVLVRTGREGQAVMRALSSQGIASVYLSNRESVLSQSEAHELLLVLQACQHPESDRYLRAALATRLFDLPPAQLEQLSDDEELWIKTVQEFRDYQFLWQERGILALIHGLIVRRKIGETLLAQDQGERRLTNLLHLGELLQQASTEVEGEFALLRWFSRAIANPSGDAQEQVLRLESEKKLVQIVTIHKSKGLEYPLVFLPFVSKYRQSDEARYHRDGTLYLDLTQSERALELGDHERLAEDLRLLYVALTRGVYATWIGVAEINKKRCDRSALGYLFGYDTITQALERLALALQDNSELSIAIDPPDLTEVDEQLTPDITTLQAPHLLEFRGKIERDWRLTSYSNLVQHRSHELRAGFDSDALGEEQSGEITEASIFSFPRGARAGTLLHDLLERFDRAALLEPETLGEIETQLRRAGFEPEWAPILQSHLVEVLGCDLGQGFSLSDLSRKQVEMEFFLPMAHLDGASWSAIAKTLDPISQQAEPLHFRRLQGMLKGFIDLLFEWQGRWYLLDYKSNYLGDSVADYHPEALEGAMRKHRYDLQYQIYLVALHRLLKLRLPDYDPSRHLGGVYYLFLRGMPQGGVLYLPPRLELVEQLDQLLAGSTL